MSLAADKTGCVRVDGAKLGPKPPPAPEPWFAPALVSGPPDRPAASDPVQPGEAIVEQVAPSQPEADEQLPDLELAVHDSGAVEFEEIRATAVGDPQTPALEIEAEVASESNRPTGELLRLGPKLGGVLPRGDLRPGFSIGLLVDVPLAVMGVPTLEVGGIGLDSSVYLEGGWSPMRQQDVVLLPGRGRTELIQNSLVPPFEVGVRARLDLGPFWCPTLPWDRRWTSLAPSCRPSARRPNSKTMLPRGQRGSR